MQPMTDEYLIHVERMVTIVTDNVLRGNVKENDKYITNLTKKDRYWLTMTLFAILGSIDYNELMNRI